MQRRTPSQSKDNAKNSNVGRSRDDAKKGNASGSGESSKRNSMDSLAQDHEGKDNPTSTEKGAAESKDEGSNPLSSSTVTSSQDDATGSKRNYYDEDGDDDDVTKRKKRKDLDDKEPMAKPAPVQRGPTGRVLTGTKPPGPASKTGASPLGKGGAGSNANKGTGGSTSGKSSTSSQKGTSGKGKASGSAKSSGSQSKDRQKSPVASPKANQGKDEEEDSKAQESSAPKVPPLKIVIPGGAGGSGCRNEQEGEGQRGSGKGRGGASTLPYVIPCTSTDAGQASDSSDTNSDDKRSGEGGKGAQRVLRSHRANDGDKDKERSPQRGSGSQSGLKSPPPSTSGDGEHNTSNVSSNVKTESRNTSVELHPRKRKIKASKESHTRNEPIKTEAIDNIAHAVQQFNPYQMHLHIRKQVEARQKGLFPVKPKPPKDFSNYMMNRCTYTLQKNAVEPVVELPPTLPPQMVEEFLAQEKERNRLRAQQTYEKEKLVLAVEQEILRVHGRAERAVANQSLPYSVCTILRDKEVYNVIAPEQEEKRNAQRSRCNGRQINSWLQEVDDKWEKIKENVLRRQHRDAETLHHTQVMNWEWKLKEVGLCENKTTPKIDPLHVPQIHVSNFDLPA